MPLRNTRWRVRATAHEPRLLAFEPSTQKRRYLTPADGLPAMPLRNVSIGPLEPGKVCVLGHFGEQRLTRVWFAIAQLDPEQGQATVKVFHDARDMPPVRFGDEWKNTHLAFSRSRIATLTEPQVAGSEPRRRIAVDRRYGHPLLIDADTLAVEASPEIIDYRPPAFPVVHDGALYWLGMSEADECRVCRFGFPDFKVQPGSHPAPLGLLAFHRQWTMVLDAGGEAWVSGQPQGPFRRLRTAWPTGDRPRWQEMRLFTSHNRALWVYDAKTQRLFEVVFPPDSELEAALPISDL